MINHSRVLRIILNSILKIGRLKQSISIIIIRLTIRTKSFLTLNSLSSRIMRNIDRLIRILRRNLTLLVLNSINGYSLRNILANSVQPKINTQLRIKALKFSNISRALNSTIMQDRSHIRLLTINMNKIGSKFRILLHLLNLPTRRKSLLPVLGNRILNRTALAILKQKSRRTLLRMQLRRVPDSLRRMLNIIIVQKANRRLSVRQTNNTVLGLRLIGRPHNLRRTSLLRLRNNMMISNINIRSRSVMNSSLNTYVTNLLGNKTRYNTVLKNSRSSLNIIISRILSIDILLNQLVINRERSSLMSNLLRLNLRIITILIPALFKLNQRQGTSDNALFSLNVATDYLTTATTAANHRTHTRNGTYRRNSSLLDRLRLLSFVFRKVTGPP